MTINVSHRAILAFFLIHGAFSTRKAARVTADRTAQAQDVYFLRHGESEYNAGGNDKHEFWGRGKKYKDAPLTELGVKQALAVSKQLDAAFSGAHGEELPEELHNMADTDCVFSSPLTRALQTCLIALKPILKKNTGLKVVLIPELRETVDWLHSDSIGDSMGEGIKKKAINKLKAMNGWDKVAKEAAFIEVDSSRAEKPWWSTKAENHHAVKERLNHFLSALSSPGTLKNARQETCRRAIVCGHSGAFRDTFKFAWDTVKDEGSYIPAWYRGSVPDWQEATGEWAAGRPSVDDLKRKKIANLGLVSTELSGTGQLTRPRLLLDTYIKGLKSKPCAVGKGSILSKPGVDHEANQFCACQWGFTCAGKECRTGMGHWKYDPLAKYVFNMDFCKDCTCVEQLADEEAHDL